jgi:hypothetical protein
MNREEAKFVLSAFRPGGTDAVDPQFQEALALVNADPELARWFAAEQALDGAFAAKLNARAVPLELRAQLLAARLIVRPVKWWRQPKWLAAAASIALFGVVAGGWLRQRAHAAAAVDFQGAMAEVGSDMEDHADVWGMDNPGYRRWLGKHGGTADFALPQSLEGKNISACKVVEWRGHKVTMLCFKAGGEHIDLFVVNADALPGFKAGATPVFDVAGDLATAAWRREGKLYFVTGEMDLSKLRALL